ncbi:MAG: DNA-deoxyinosine glycosylase [Nitrospira sp.]|nr:DNA-deoxyinosine glycosylase [Nitrospira sp.]
MSDRVMTMRVRTPGPAQAAARARLQGLPPVAAPHARLVVLGSFPGAASLAARQYYAHPRNQFWTILSTLWQTDLRALPYEARLDELRRRGLGVWDVYASCRREGSLDSAIEDATPNDLAGLFATLPRLSAVAHNGSESARALALTRTLVPQAVRLPSSSPANASWSLARKCDAWRAVFVQHGLCR